MSKLILPKTYMEPDGPVLFLVGPIRGAPRWQQQGFEIIQALDVENRIYVVSPSDRFDEKYLKMAVQDDGCGFKGGTLFERHYLKLALREEHGLEGAIAMWLPTQVEAMPINKKTGFPGPYARDTRPETGRWGTGILGQNPNAPIFVGAEENFDGLSVMKTNFLEDRPEMIFYSTLFDTCNAAVDRIYTGL